MVNKLLIVFTCRRNDSFCALPRKQLPARHAIFVTQLGRKFRLFLDNAKVQKIQSTSKFYRKKSTQKSTLAERVVNSATSYSATVKKLTVP